MSWRNGFTKTAFTSPYTKDALVKSTPKKHGGADGKIRYFLRFHPEEKRWSCTCPDWTTRRRWLPEAYKEHWDCKHIRAHRDKTKPWSAKLKMPKLTRGILDQARAEREDAIQD